MIDKFKYCEYEKEIDPSFHNERCFNCAFSDGNTSNPNCLITHLRENGIINCEKGYYIVIESQGSIKSNFIYEIQKLGLNITELSKDKIGYSLKSNENSYYSEKLKQFIPSLPEWPERLEEKKLDLIHNEE